MIAAGYGGPTNDAIDAFLFASRRPGANLDLALGRSGSLLGAAMLLPIAGERDPLHAFGRETMQAIWSELRDRPLLDGSLGMAHGWSGYLYATLRWCAASGDPLPFDLIERLHALAALKIVDGRGAYWPTTMEGLTSTWCNGTRRFGRVAEWVGDRSDGYSLPGRRRPRQRCIFGSSPVSLANPASRIL